MAKIKRNELTIASVLFMLLVIFIHAAAEGVSGYRKDSLPYVLLLSAQRLSSFVVQGFIFLSGIKLFLHTDRPFSYKQFYLGRLRRVVLPYLAAYCIFYIYTAAAGYITPTVPYFFRELVTGGLIGHFYFVVIICQFYLLMPLWRRLSEQNPVLVTSVSLLLMIMAKTAVPEVLAQFGIDFPYNARMFWSYLFYFIAGIYVGKYYDIWQELLRRYRWGLLAAFAVCGCIDCMNILVIRRGLYYPSWAENFHILYCITAAAVVMLLAEKLARVGDTVLVRLTDRASYNVYLIHPLFIYMTDSILFRAGVQSLTGRFLIRLFAAVLLSVGVCILWEAGKDAVQKQISKNRKKSG